MLDRLTQRVYAARVARARVRAYFPQAGLRRRALGGEVTPGATKWRLADIVGQAGADGESVGDGTFSVVTTRGRVTRVVQAFGNGVSDREG